MANKEYMDKEIKNIGGLAGMRYLANVSAPDKNGIKEVSDIHIISYDIVIIPDERIS